MKDLQPIINLISKGQYDQAEKRLRKILGKDARCLDAWNLLSILQHQTGKLDDAIQSITKMIDLNDHSPDLYRKLASCYFQKKQYALAIQWAKAAVQIKPAFLDAWLLLSDAEFALDRIDDALASLNEALKISPHHAGMLVNAGVALLRKKNFGAAIENYKKALKIDPNHLDALVNLAAALIETGKYLDAFDANERALSLNPNHKGALNHKGCINMHLGKYADAAAAYKRLVAIDSANPAALNDLGVALSSLLQNQEAIELYQRELNRYPDYHPFRWNLAPLLLMQGDYQAGFALFEYRSKIKEISLQPRQVATPQWQGEKIEGKTLLVRCEQGYGDSIEFLRYIPCLAPYRCQIIIELYPKLHCLVQHLGFPLTDPEEAAKSHDIHINMMSFPYVFKTDLFSIPPPITLETQLRPIKNRIAIVWKGNPKHMSDRRRSLQREPLNSLLEIPGVDFVSLQKDPTPEEAELLDARGALRPEIQSFSDTLHLLEECERVICVDTAIAHLAGSMGIPTWILIPYVPDWRWLLNRRDSPWYPAVRLFRQSIMDSWAEPIEEIRKELEKR